MACSGLAEDTAKVGGLKAVRLALPKSAATCLKRGRCQALNAGYSTGIPAPGSARATHRGGISASTPRETAPAL